MKLNLKILLFFILILNLNAQENNLIQQNISINEFVNGTLLSSNNEQQSNLAILIADSGPTDRDGNQNFLKNNVLRKLAFRLSEKGIATFRYDKRTVKLIRQRRSTTNTNFNDFVEDAISCINYFKNSGKYKNIYLIGHGQGSLVGMLASNKDISGFISIAGSGQGIDQVILEQVEKTAPMFTQDAKNVIKSLKKGNVTNNFPPALASLFSQDIQPFMISWMQYNPQLIIKDLNIPVLIINGSKDLQVSIEESNLLKEASLNASLKIIQDMNHVLTTIKGDRLENSKSYNEAFRKISPELVESITQFIFTN